MIIFSLFIWVLTFVAYEIFRPDSLISLINRSSAVTAVILLAITLLIGPLSHFYPKYFEKHKDYRKKLGLLTVVYGLIHIFITSYTWNIPKAIAYTSSNRSAIILGVLAAILLLAISLTSNKKVFENIKFPLWKAIQFTSYVVLALLIVHFALIKKSSFLFSPIGIFLLVLSTLAILARGLIVIKEIYRKKELYKKQIVKH